MANRNPAGIKVSPLLDRISPTEQDVYATAHLARALANSGDVDSILAFEWCAFFPTQESADLAQTAILGIRRTG
jgi:hypothetical protein